MNQGLFLAVAAGFLWSVTNIIDKVVLSRLIKHPALVMLASWIVSLVAGLVTLPRSSEWPVGVDWWWMALSGFLYMLGMLWYFIALKREEPSRVIPLYALAIVFLTILSAVFLDEVFSFRTYIGIGLVVVATIVIVSRRNFLEAFHSKALGIMVLSTLAYAVSYVAMKHLLGTYSDMEVFSIQHIFTGIFGLVVMAFYSSEIRSAYHEARKRHLSIVALSEILGVAGGYLFIAASAVWFVTLVETVMSIQYVFVFLWSFLISRFWPSLSTEEMTPRIIVQKIAAIAMIIGGVALLTL